MHYSEYFLKNRNIINQEIFNKKINWFFDIKSISHHKIKNKDIKKFAIQLTKNYQKLKSVNNLRNKSVKIKITTLEKYLKKNSSLKLNKLLNYIQKCDIDEYFKYFLIQGSIASRDYIIGWSDIDTWTVLKDETLEDPKKLIKLREILYLIYKKINLFSKLQHHGIVVYTELDIKNYLPGYLPKEALIKNIAINKNVNEEINIFLSNRKNNLSIKILRDKFFFLKRAIQKSEYNHHVLKKTPEIPFKKNQPYLFELFYHIGTILNIPILFLDSINKSSHKKDSFKKFYKLINNKFVENFIFKHEKIRRNWKSYKIKNLKIPEKLLDDLGENYFENCLKIYKIILNKIKDTK